MTQGTLHGVMDTLVYTDERASWELHEAYYSRPEYAWPLVQYFRMVLGAHHVKISAATMNAIWSAFEGTVVEPCVGNGDLVAGMRRYGLDGATFLTGDVRDVGPTTQWTGDWLAECVVRRDGTVLHSLSGAHLVVTNPPFSLAMEIVEASWRRCPNAVVAILQRSTWYEPTKRDPRGEWLREHNPDKITIGRCEFFWPDGTSVGAGDSCSYTWYVWGPDKQGPLGGHHCITPWWEAPAV